MVRNNIYIYLFMSRENPRWLPTCF